jgi:hypothetical protein
MVPSWPTEKVVWCGRGDLNPHDLLGSADFHTTSAFAASLREFVVWTIPSPFLGRGLGAAHLVSTPSRNIRAWLGIAIQGFPDFEQFYSAGFPSGHSIYLSPLCLPISPRPRKTDDSSHHKASGNGVYVCSARPMASTRPRPFTEIVCLRGAYTPAPSNKKAI